MIIKCDFKHCKHLDSDELNEYGNKKYHDECKIDIDNLNNVARLYKKYISDKESEDVMFGTLHKLHKKHESEYILFCISKVIRENHSIKNFFSLYSIVNNLNFMKRYEVFKNKSNNMIFENVILSKEEYQMLLDYMGKLSHHNANKKLEYYIRKLNDYIIKTGREYNSHYETLKQWYDKEELKKPIPRKSTII